MAIITLPTCVLCVRNSNFSRPKVVDVTLFDSDVVLVKGRVNGGVETWCS